MTDYPFGMQLAVAPLDENNIIRDGEVWIFEPSDTNGVSPLALTDLSGLPMTNPLRSNAFGNTRPFITTVPQVKWKSGVHEGLFDSFKGMFDEAAAAKLAAQEAAVNAADAAVADVAARIAAGEFTGAPGQDGADGSNVLPTDDAIEQAVLTDGTKTKAALSATYAGVKKTDEGGQFLKPIRVPTLTTHRSFPDARVNFRVIHADGDRVYAIGRDKSLRVSTNGGLNWVLKVRPMTESAYGYKDCFMRLPSGDLVALRNDSNYATPSINAYYSTAASDGAVWTKATGGPFQAGTQPLGSQSFCRDATTGYLYYAEYAITGADLVDFIQVWRSTDEGRSWSVFHQFPGRNSSAADKVRHLHSIQYDPVSQRVYVCAGDSENAAGIYRVNAGGTAMEPVVTNAQIGNMRACVIGIMWFPNYLVWGTDNSSDSALYRMHRNQIGQPSPVIEKIYRLSGSAWWSIKANAAGTKWLVSVSNEVAAPGAPLDKSSHLYAVEDEGATVWEVATLGDAGQTPVMVQPVGPGGDKFWVSSRSFKSNFSAMMSLDRGGSENLGLVAPLQPIYERIQTINSGVAVTIPSGGSVTFGHAVVPHGYPFFYGIDYGVYKTAGTTVKVRAVKASDSSTVAFLDDGSTAYGASTGRASSFVNLQQLTPGDVILFQMYETTSLGTVTATAFVTFGFGPGASSANGDWDSIGRLNTDV